MATITAGESKAAVARPTQGKAAEAQVEVAAPNRREFLYYIWGASFVLLFGGTTAGLIWFALPRFREGTFGGVFNLTGDRIPSPGSAPISEPSGRFWVSNTPEGLVVLYGVCTHLGCLPKWVDVNNRFECPCHGSRFELNGRFIEGPAPRSLDRFATRIIFTDGTIAEMNAQGDPIPLNGRQIAKVEIDTGKRIQRAGQI